jgi:predicted metalloprotease
VICYQPGTPVLFSKTVQNFPKFNGQNFQTMKWIGRRQSSNVENRRGVSGGQVAVGGGIVGIIVVVLNLLMGGDPNEVLRQMQQSDQQVTHQASPQEDSLAAFVSVVLADNEDVWHSLFQQMGRQYQEPKLVMFTGSTESGCGYASSGDRSLLLPG